MDLYADLYMYLALVCDPRKYEFRKRSSFCIKFSVQARIKAGIKEFAKAFLVKNRIFQSVNLYECVFCYRLYIQITDKRHAPPFFLSMGAMEVNADRGLYVLILFHTLISDRSKYCNNRFRVSFKPSNYATAGPRTSFLGSQSTR